MVFFQHPLYIVFSFNLIFQKFQDVASCPFVPVDLFYNPVFCPGEPPGCPLRPPRQTAQETSHCPPFLSFLTSIP